MFADRKASYKLPPGALVDVRQSQQARREKALEEQKRRRAQKIDACRQLERFADLTLGPSDDEVDDDTTGEPIREGVAPFASLLSESPSSIPTAPPPAETSGKDKQTDKKGKKRKRKHNKWADKCMYAELLEMDEENSWSDGLPADLESGWVAVAPVPVGKRCLAVTHQSGGFPNVGPNTSLRSRLLGKTLLPPFPSPLPPSTILDCILDPNWEQNGILHVLDVIQWKGQEVGDCETAFRFWWRDTRLAELAPVPAPPCAPPPDDTFPTLPSPNPTYRFPHPTTFLPIPYHPSTSTSSLLASIIPQARYPRYVVIHIPFPTDPAFPSHSSLGFGFGSSTQPVTFEVAPDGMLLYVAQASYEPGSSPLSSWVPIGPCVKGSDPSHIGPTHDESALDKFERLVKRRLMREGSVEVDMDRDG